MKNLMKRALQRTPYRIVRATDRNRFDAQQETLLALRERGYAPKRVLDGGANLGHFARMVRSLFVDARIDLVEPQPACWRFLQALATTEANHVLHTVAIGREKGQLQMTFDLDIPSTGAHVAETLSADTCASLQPVQVETLDSILAGVTAADRTLLKLDLQGWELEALQGALSVLPAIEVILTEVSFFAQAYEPPIATLIGFLNEQGFVLGDIAALTARRRDNRAHQADFVFVRKDSALNADRAWA